MPGDNITMTIHLINPVALEEGVRFAIRRRAAVPSVPASLLKSWSKDRYAIRRSARSWHEKDEKIVV